MKYRVTVRCEMLVTLDMDAASPEAAKAWAQTADALSYIEAHNQEAQTLEVQSVVRNHDNFKVDITVEAP